MCQSCVKQLRTFCHTPEFCTCIRLFVLRDFINTDNQKKINQSKKKQRSDDITIITAAAVWLMCSFVCFFESHKKFRLVIHNWININTTYKHLLTSFPYKTTGIPLRFETLNFHRKNKQFDYFISFTHNSLEKNPVKMGILDDFTEIEFNCMKITRQEFKSFEDLFFMHIFICHWIIWAILTTKLFKKN